VAAGCNIGGKSRQRLAARRAISIV
jgi:hypothetical protein